MSTAPPVKRRFCPYCGTFNVKRQADGRERCDACGKLAHRDYPDYVPVERHMTATGGATP